jgi:hypothetical protein
MMYSMEKKRRSRYCSTGALGAPVAKVWNWAASGGKGSPVVQGERQGESGLLPTLEDLLPGDKKNLDKGYLLLLNHWPKPTFKFRVAFFSKIL